ncbi:MAG: response regulator transcription factor, partial [Desulfobacterales bacterium]|nr:response regulator transcription factor [Desulfobacterales bacterium]
MILQTILIIEDEERIAHWVQSYFKRAGFQTMVARDGPTGLDMALEQNPDLIILDLMLPGLDGRELCRQVRGYSDVPIIMLTARDGQRDRIAGLDMGADDYVVKPFDPEELVARARAVLR